jgi:cyclohexyl-isocyanide hydratase
MIPQGQILQIGSLLFEGLDQIDLTGPFEVLSRLPNSTYRIYGKTIAPVRDVKGLLLTPDAVLMEAPQLDVLHVPGGPGQEALMNDDDVLDWVRNQAAGAQIVFSVCTGALICGAAGLLKGRRATTYWAATHLLPYFGATPVDARVVVDGNLVCAAGVTAGLDGALTVAAAGGRSRRDHPALHAIRAGAAGSRRVCAGGDMRTQGPTRRNGAGGGQAARRRAPSADLTGGVWSDINPPLVVIWPAGLQPRKISR